MMKMRGIDSMSTIEPERSVHPVAESPETRESAETEVMISR